MLKHLALIAVLLAVVLSPLPVCGQANDHRTGSSVAVDADSLTTVAQNTAPATDSGNSDHPAPHVSVVNAPPLVAAPAPRTIFDTISWAANLVLTILAYVGIMFAWQTLKRIHQQATFTEAAAHAALEGSKAAQDAAKAAQGAAQAAQEAARAAQEGARAALEASKAALEGANATSLYAQAHINAERPWVLISIEPSREQKNHFKVMATNRGRTPAKLFASSDRIGLAVDETYLPKTPEYASKESSALPAPIILLPGESTIIQPFGREDVKWVCKTAESLRRVELWQDRIFIYGKVIYRDLISPDGTNTHESDWCCRYIHGENSSDLVIAGPPGYNKHT